MHVLSVSSVSLSLALLSLVACGASSNDGTSTTEEDLSRKKPIPFVLQYVGDYEGNDSGRVDYILLNRDGTWVGSIDGWTKHGTFYGPTKVPSPLMPPALVLVTTGLRIDAQIDPGVGWAPNDTMRVTFNGYTQTLTAPWASGNEAICDATHGAWTDDDADPKTGLFCICPAHQSFIPSMGGCVR